MNIELFASQRNTIKVWVIVVAFCSGLCVGNSFSMNRNSSSSIPHLSDNINTTTSSENSAEHHGNSSSNNITIPYHPELLSPINGSDADTKTTVISNDSKQDDKDGNESASSTTVNLAIIPGLAVLLLIIALCIRGCRWFTEYARAGDKEMYDKYASIVQVGDDDYDSVDFRSESVSTGNYDTVSSVCSFMRKSPIEECVTSKTPVTPDLAQTARAKSLILSGQGRVRPKDISIHKVIVTNKNRPESGTSLQLKRSVECQSKYTSPLSQRSRPSPSHTQRTISLSSTEESNYSLVSEDDSIKSPRRNQKFKVSFGTEGAVSEPKTTPMKETDVLRPIITNSRATCMLVKADIEHRPDDVGSITKRSVDRLGSESLKENISNRSERALKHCKNGVYRNPYCRSASDQSGSRSKVMTSDCGTQTKRSYRADFRKPRRIVSESGADDSVVPPTIHELVELTHSGPKGETGVVSKQSDCDSRHSDKGVIKGSGTSVHRPCSFPSEGRKGNGARVHTFMNANRDNVESPVSNSELNVDKECLSLTLNRIGYEVDRTNGCRKCDLVVGDRCDAIKALSTRKHAKITLTRNDAVDCTDIGNDSNGNLLHIEGMYSEKIDVFCDLCKANTTLNSLTGLKCTQLRHLQGLCVNNKPESAISNETGCDVHLVDEISSEEPLLSKTDVNAGTNCVKRELSLASDGTSSSMTSLSSSGFAENYSSCSNSA